MHKRCAVYCAWSCAWWHQVGLRLGDVVAPRAALSFYEFREVFSTRNFAPGKRFVESYQTRATALAATSDTRIVKQQSGRLLGRHQWRVWRHGARGSAHEQPDSECVERRTDGSGFRISPFRPVHSGLKLYLLTRRRGAHTAHTQVGRPTHEAPTREYTHKHKQTHSPR